MTVLPSTRQPSTVDPDLDPLEARTLDAVVAHGNVGHVVGRILVVDRLEHALAAEVVEVVVVHGETRTNGARRLLDVVAKGRVARAVDLEVIELDVAAASGEADAHHDAGAARRAPDHVHGLGRRAAVAGQTNVLALVDLDAEASARSVADLECRPAWSHGDELVLRSLEAVEDERRQATGGAKAHRRTGRRGGAIDHSVGGHVDHHGAARITGDLGLRRRCPCCAREDDRAEKELGHADRIATRVPDAALENACDIRAAPPRNGCGATSCVAATRSTRDARCRAR